MIGPLDNVVLRIGAKCVQKASAADFLQLLRAFSQEEIGALMAFFELEDASQEELLNRVLNTDWLPELAKRKELIEDPMLESKLGVRL